MPDSSLVVSLVPVIACTWTACNILRDYDYYYNRGTDIRVKSNVARFSVDVHWIPLHGNAFTTTV
jgi:hypothetical protein